MKHLVYSNEKTGMHWIADQTLLISRWCMFDKIYLVYKSTVTANNNNKPKTYISITENDFKTRFSPSSNVELHMYQLNVNEDSLLFKFIWTFV